MKFNFKTIEKIAAVFLSVSLVLPSPAYSARVAASRNSGVAAELEGSLSPLGVETRTGNTLRGGGVSLLAGPVAASGGFSWKSLVRSSRLPASTPELASRNEARATAQAWTAETIAEKVRQIIFELLNMNTVGTPAFQLGYTSPEALTDHLRLTEDLGADSLDPVEIAMEVERTFDVVISDDETSPELDMLLTVGGWIRFVQNRVLQSRAEIRSFEPANQDQLVQAVIPAAIEVVKAFPDRETTASDYYRGALARLNQLLEFATPESANALREFVTSDRAQTLALQDRDLEVIRLSRTLVFKPRAEVRQFNSNFGALTFEAWANAIWTDSVRAAAFGRFLNSSRQVPGRVLVEPIDQGGKIITDKYAQDPRANASYDMGNFGGNHFSDVAVAQRFAHEGLSPLTEAILIHPGKQMGLLKKDGTLVSLEQLAANADSFKAADYQGLTIVAHPFYQAELAKGKYLAIGNEDPANPNQADKFTDAAQIGVLLDKLEAKLGKIFTDISKEAGLLGKLKKDIPQLEMMKLGLYWDSDLDQASKTKMVNAFKKLSAQAKAAGMLLAPENLMPKTLMMNTEKGRKVFSSSLKRDAKDAAGNALFTSDAEWDNYLTQRVSWQSENSIDFVTHLVDANVDADIIKASVPISLEKLSDGKTEAMPYDARVAALKRFATVSYRPVMWLSAGADNLPAIVREIGAIDHQILRKSGFVLPQVGFFPGRAVFNPAFKLVRSNIERVAKAEANGATIADADRKYLVPEGIVDGTPAYDAWIRPLVIEALQDSNGPAVKMFKELMGVMRTEMSPVWDYMGLTEAQYSHAVAEAQATLSRAETRIAAIAEEQDVFENALTVFLNQKVDLPRPIPQDGSTQVNGIEGLKRYVPTLTVSTLQEVAEKPGVKTVKVTVPAGATHQEYFLTRRVLWQMQLQFLGEATSVNFGVNNPNEDRLRVPQKKRQGSRVLLDTMSPAPNLDLDYMDSRATTLSAPAEFEIVLTRSEMRNEMRSDLFNRSTPVDSREARREVRLTREELSSFRAYPERFVAKEGQKLWVPLNFLSKPAEVRTFGGRQFPAQLDKSKFRSQEEMLDLIERKHPKVVGMQRFIDVGGSSIDLRALQKLLTKTGVDELDFLTSTTIVAGDFPLSLTMQKAQAIDGFDAKDVIEYVIEGKKKDGDKTVNFTKTYVVVRKDGKLWTRMEDGILRAFIAEEDGDYQIWDQSGNARTQKRKKGQVIDGQYGAFAFFMNEIGLWGSSGHFITHQPVAEAGGLGRSGASNAMIVALASQLAGAELKKGDMQAETVEVEGNGEDDKLAIFGGYTGGQESGATFQGGASQMIHLSEVKNGEGNYQWPVGTELVIPLTQTLEEANTRMLSHVALVQAGLPFKDGKATIKRTAGGINTTWCARGKELVAEVKDEAGIALHARKTMVAMVAAYGVMHDRWDLVIWSQNEHRIIRNELDRGFYDIALQELEQKEGRPAFAKKYLEILENDPILNRYLTWHKNGKDDAGKPFDLRKISLYSMTSEPLIEALTEFMRKKTGNPNFQLTDLDSEVAVFIPGAGGTGSPAVIIAKTPELLNEILQFLKLKNAEGQDVNLKQFTEDDVLSIMGGTGLLQGYLQPKAGKAIEFENLPANYPKLQDGFSGVYDQTTGIYYITDPRSQVPDEVLLLPRVKMLEDHPDIKAAYEEQAKQALAAQDAQTLREFAAGVPLTRENFASVMERMKGLQRHLAINFPDYPLDLSNGSMSTEHVAGSGSDEVRHQNILRVVSSGSRPRIILENEFDAGVSKYHDKISFQIELETDQIVATTYQIGYGGERINVHNQHAVLLGQQGNVSLRYREYPVNGKPRPLIDVVLSEAAFEAIQRVFNFLPETHPARNFQTFGFGFFHFTTAERMRNLPNLLAQPATGAEGHEAFNEPAAANTLMPSIILEEQPALGHQAFNEPGSQPEFRSEDREGEVTAVAVDPDDVDAFSAQMVKDRREHAGARQYGLGFGETQSEDRLVSAGERVFLGEKDGVFYTVEIKRVELADGPNTFPTVYFVVFRNGNDQVAAEQAVYANGNYEYQGLHLQFGQVNPKGQIHVTTNPSIRAEDRKHTDRNFTADSFATVLATLLTAVAHDVNKPSTIRIWVGNELKETHTVHRDDDGMILGGVPNSQLTADNRGGRIVVDTKDRITNLRIYRSEIRAETRNKLPKVDAPDVADAASYSAWQNGEVPPANLKVPAEEAVPAGGVRNEIRQQVEVLNLAHPNWQPTRDGIAFRFDAAANELHFYRQADWPTPTRTYTSREGINGLRPGFNGNVELYGIPLHIHWVDAAKAENRLVEITSSLPSRGELRFLGLEGDLDRQSARTYPAATSLAPVAFYGSLVQDETEKVQAQQDRPDSLEPVPAEATRAEKRTDDRDAIGNDQVDAGDRGARISTPRTELRQTSGQLIHVSLNGDIAIIDEPRQLGVSVKSEKGVISAMLWSRGRMITDPQIIRIGDTFSDGGNLILELVSTDQSNAVFKPVGVSVVDSVAQNLPDGATSPTGQRIEPAIVRQHHESATPAGQSSSRAWAGHPVDLPRAELRKNNRDTKLVSLAPVANPLFTGMKVAANEAAQKAMLNRISEKTGLSGQKQAPVDGYVFSFAYDVLFERGLLPVLPSFIGNAPAVIRVKNEEQARVVEQFNLELQNLGYLTYHIAYDDAEALKLMDLEINAAEAAFGKKLGRAVYVMADSADLISGFRAAGLNEKDLRRLDNAQFKMILGITRTQQSVLDKFVQKLQNLGAVSRAA